MNPLIDPVDELLNRCGTAAEPSPRLAAEVRRQVAARPPAPSLTWATRLDIVFGRPSFAAAFIAAWVLLGLFLAEARLTQWHAARGAQIARSYVQLIDPLLKPAPLPSVAAIRPP